MPIQQLPLMKGVGKDFTNADYVDLLPVNMLATPKEVLDSDGYLRSFPGIAQVRTSNGTSRGAIYNTNQNQTYRVMGSRLYRGSEDIGSVNGTGRVGMAYSYNSQAVNASGYVYLYDYDGQMKTLSNWPDGDAAQYDIGLARDICRNRARYIWCKEGTDTFGVTDLEDESHPDRYRPFYRAESQPDGIVGLAAWRDYVVCFGSSTIEYFALTGSSNTSDPIYIVQPALMVEMGISGTYAKCSFIGTFAFISNPSRGAPSIYTINSGRADKIASSTVEKILRSYTADELSSAYLENVRFDGHELLIVHLLRHVLCFDASVTGSPQWCILATGYDGSLYRGTDFIYEGNTITVGDKLAAAVGKLDFSNSSQYGSQSECILFTPMFKADNARVFDFELESSTGVAQYADKLFISATVDGITYGQEKMVSNNNPYRYNLRPVWKVVGRIRKNIGFKVRIITANPVTLSGCRIRIE